MACVQRLYYLCWMISLFFDAVNSHRSHLWMTFCMVMPEGRVVTSSLSLSPSSVPKKHFFFRDFYMENSFMDLCVIHSQYQWRFFFVCLMTIKNDEYRTFFVEKKVFNAKYDDFCCVDSQPRTYHYFFYILAFYPTIWLFTENLIKYRFYYMIGFWHISYQQCRLRTIKDSCCVIYASLSFFPCLSVFLSVCLSVRNFFLLFVWLFFSLFPYLLRSYR